MCDSCGNFATIIIRKEKKNICGYCNGGKTQ